MTEEPKKSNATTWILGCAGVLVLMGILCAFGGYWAVGKGKAVLAEKLGEAGAELLENSNLPEDQVVAIERDIERLRAGILEGDIALENLGNIDGELEDLALLGGIQFYSAFVIPNTPLTEEEKVAGQRIIQRYARGVSEGVIDPGESNHSFNLNTKPDSKEGERFSATEVREDLAVFKGIVDEAGIPDEPYQLDLAVRFEELVDSLLE